MLKSRDEWPLWNMAIKEDLQSMSENRVWTLIDKLPSGKRE